MSDERNDLIKKNQLLVLEALNELFNECGHYDPDKAAISIAAVVIFSDGSTSSKISGMLDRAQMTGQLVDLSNQVFFECKQREIQAQVDDMAEKQILAAMPTKPDLN